MKNVLIIAAFLITTALAAQTRTQVDGQRDELGKVSWFRDYDEALVESKRINKPVLILFQEEKGKSEKLYAMDFTEGWEKMTVRGK